MRHISRMNASCHTHECVTWYIEWVMSRIIMSRIWMRHVTRINKSCYTNACGVTHMRVSHLPHVNESCHTCQWDISQIKKKVWLQMWVSRITHISLSHVTQSTSHVTHVSESCHTYQWLMSHIRMSHVTHIHASCHAWVMSHVWHQHVTHLFAPNLAHSKHMVHTWIRYAHTNESCVYIYKCHPKLSSNDATSSWHIQNAWRTYD